MSGRWVSIVGFIVLLGMGWSVRSDACSCLPPGPPRAELERADAVFVATVLDFTAGMRRVTEGTFMSNDRVFRMRVLAAWKGAGAETLFVRTGAGGGDCGYDFMLKDTYVVYAYRAGRSDTLATSICSRTRPITHADDDLNELGTPAIDHRGGRKWSAFAPPEFCPLHRHVPLRLSWAWPRYTTTDHSLMQYEQTADREFPYAATPLFRDSGDRALRSGTLNDARVCPMCRESALAWLDGHGADCDADYWIEHQSREAAEPSPISGELSDTEYRARYPNANFAFLYDDGRRFEIDTIESKYDRHIGTIRDTAFAMTLSREDLDRVYEKMIALRLFDIAEPHPTYTPSAPIERFGPCARERLFFRSDLFVRQLQWNSRKVADPQKLVPEWAKIAEVTALIREIVAARPEVRALPPLPVD